MKKDLENVIKKDREEQPDAKGEDSDTQETEVSNEDEEDYSNWPMEGIKDPSTNDVLYGRGGGTNHHTGNKRYRKMVEGRKVDYVNSKRLDKPLVALNIIQRWRGQKPPGRFLKFDDKKESWLDVGDKKAREKTSQALREKAPLLRKQQEEQRQEVSDNSSHVEETSRSPETMSRPESKRKNTRFNVSHDGIRPSKNIDRVPLCREHSLGRDYVPQGDMSLKGFSWEDSGKDSQMQGAAPVEPQGDQRWNQPPDLREARPYYSAYNPSGALPYSDNTDDRPRTSITEPATSTSFEEPIQYSTTPAVRANHHWQQHSPYSAPSAPHSDERLQTEWTKRSYSEEQVHEQDYLRQTRSAEHDYRSNSYRGQEHQWHQGGGSRSPIPNAPVGYDGGNPAYMHHWEGYHNGYHFPNPAEGRGPPPYNPNHHQWASPNRYNPYPGQYPPQPYRSPEHSYPSQQGYNHVGYGNVEVPHTSPLVQNSPLKRTGLDYGTPNDSESSCSPSRSIPRPQPIKRDTSHQNETCDTKSQVKRTNRQRSIGNRRQVNENDVHNLGRHFRQSSLGEYDPASSPLQRPEHIIEEDRILTMDQADIINAIEGSSSPLDKPSCIQNEARSNSLESIAIDDVHQLCFSSMNKPNTLAESDRLNTFGSIGTEAS
eukprot:scaffold279_cov246-Chaetoceros_neogracile.AAC.8